MIAFAQFAGALLGALVGFALAAAVYWRVLAEFFGWLKRRELRRRLADWSRDT